MFSATLSSSTERKLLRDHRDAAVSASRMFLEGDGMAVDAQARLVAAVRVDAGEQLNERGFARTVSPQSAWTSPRAAESSTPFSATTLGIFFIKAWNSSRGADIGISAGL